jgi:hypothetical protein
MYCCVILGGERGQEGQGEKVALNKKRPCVWKKNVSTKNINCFIFLSPVAPKKSTMDRLDLPDMSSLSLCGEEGEEIAIPTPGLCVQAGLELVQTIPSLGCVGVCDVDRSGLWVYCLQAGASIGAEHLRYCITLYGVTVELGADVFVAWVARELAVNGPCVFVAGSGACARVRFAMRLIGAGNGGSELIAYMLEK